MPIVQIIEEIDAYLSSLRQARDLLVAPITEPNPLKRPAPSKKKVRVSAKPKRHASSRKETIQKSKPPSVRHGSERPPADGRRANSIPEVPRPVAQPRVKSVAAPAVSIPAIAMHDGHDDGTLSIKPTVLKPRVRRVVTRAAHSKTDAATKPAIALGSVKPKIVVVSAEELKRERENATQPVVQRPRTPASGLTGKRAFEALFKDASGPSHTSGQ